MEENFVIARQGIGRALVGQKIKTCSETTTGFLRRDCSSVYPFLAENLLKRNKCRFRTSYPVAFDYKLSNFFSFLNGRTFLEITV